MPEVVLEIASIAARAGAKIAYGDKVEIDGAETVPVALALYGFGGGSGGAGDQQGSGGGGGSISIPVGMLVNRRGTVRFVPNVVAVLGVGIPLTAVATVGTALVLRLRR
ncbi:MAG: hypothetical protein FWF90_06925 [Promicromonosporaceae bacterium]|nr:hypothetical protein [Promicromonosporaceae bacterium]